MNDKTIIQALEFCKMDFSPMDMCHCCVAYEDCEKGKFVPQVLQLIKRQKSTIKRLKKEEEDGIDFEQEFYELYEKFDELTDELEELQKEKEVVEIKAYEKFADKLKKKHLDFGFYPAITSRLIQRTLEEMVGEEE